MVIKKKLY